MQCNKCNVEKSIDHFYKTSRGFYLKICNLCKSARYKKWSNVNKDKIASYYLENKESRIEYMRQYRLNNIERYKDYQTQYQFDKYQSDIGFKLKKRLRNRLYLALKKNQKTGSAVRDMGCSIEELRLYVEKLWEPGMTWDNYGKWHIDHILPLSSFDLTNREQFLKACHYANLQPLWAKDNLIKSDNIKEVTRVDN